MKLLKPIFTAGKEPTLDGLRAWAILLVLFTHVCQTIPGLSFVWGKVEWATPLYNGWIGVDLFFVLSGFLVGGQVFRAFEDKRFSFFHFYARRSLRIFPAYFSVLALVGLTWSAFPAVRPYFNLDSDISLSVILKNCFFITNYFPADMGVASWSLSIEEQFYLLIPIVFTLLAKYQKKTKLFVFMQMISICLIIRMITYRYYDIGPGYPDIPLKDRIYSPFHTRMDALAAGVCAYILHESDFKIVLAFAASYLRFLGLLFVGYVFLTGALAGGWFETTLQYTLLAVGFGSMLLGVLNDKTSYLARFLSASIWVPIARLSYSIYLVHILVINAVHYAFGNSNHHLFMALSMWLCAFAIAIPLYLFIETPLHRVAQKQFSLGKPG